MPREVKGGKHLLFAIDSNNETRWLIDGGAAYSIVPPSPQQRAAGPNAWQLQAANGSDIACFGLTDRDVCIDDRVFTFTFIIADVQQPILGADFLSTFYLAPNHRDKCLIDLTDFSTVSVRTNENAQTKHVPNINLVGPSQPTQDQYYQLLDSYPALSTPSFKPKEVSHGVHHYIPTNCQPIQSKSRPLNPDKLEIAKQEFDKLLELGICYRGKSEWASPLMVAPKPGGGWRVCGDYRRLNAATIDDKYPVKSLADFNSKLCGKTIFSKIDLLKGYHQIPVAPNDIGKTAVITPFGLFIFPRTPFGLKNAGQDFQRLMDSILGDLPFCYVYLDDILVFSNSPSEHLEHLRQIFEILEANGLVVNRPKCVLGVSELDFLGFRVTKEGILPLAEKVEAIRAVKVPTTVKELQRFCGMVNYYRKSIRQAAHHMDALFAALEGKPKTLKWTEERDIAFKAIKEALANCAMLRHPRHNATLALTTDASDIAMGAVLEQRGPQGWEPLAFFSARFKNNERRWPPFDRELCAAFRSIRHFRYMLEGRFFTLYTDHQSLVPALHKKTEPLTARQTYQLSGIAEYTTDIRYLEGKANVVADALSRPNGPIATEEEEHIFLGCINGISGIRKKPLPPSPKLLPPPPRAPAAIEKSLSNEKLENLNAAVNSIVSLGIDFEEMAREQPLDADFTRISRDPNSGIALRKVPMGQHSLHVDISNGPARPFVPFSWRRRVFDAIHGLGHPGIERTRQMIREKFVWPSIRADTSKWARECVQCQRAKIQRHVVPEIGEFVLPNRRFAHLHVDLTKMPESNGYCHLLTIVDRFTRWPTAIPLKDTTTESVIDAIAHRWISSFGVPKAITTDRGPQFTSATWRQLCDTWGIEAHLTTSYHPEANGLVERFHRRLKESLMAQCGDNGAQWFWRLPMALLAIRTTMKPDVGSSPAELVYGEGLAVPGELLPDVISEEDDLTQQRKRLLGNLRLEVERLQPKPTSSHRQPQIHLPDELENATHVFVRRGGLVHPPLTSPYEGPFKVESRTKTGFKVHLPGRGVDEIALARIKPANIDVEDNAEGGDSQTPSPPPSPPQSPPSPPAGQPPPSPSAQQPGTRKSRRRGVPHIADFNRSKPPKSRQVKQEPGYEDSNCPDPYDGHTPTDPNLTPCQCDSPDNPEAPCNKEPLPPPPITLPLSVTPHPRSIQDSNRHRPRLSRTSMRPDSADAGGTSNSDPKPVASTPGRDFEDNQTSVPQTVTPHPRQLQSSDLSRRKARPNYAPALSAIIKSHLGM